MLITSAVVNNHSLHITHLKLDFNIYLAKIIFIGYGDNVILGIDEAGRGPVIGPMVIAGVILEQIPEGVKDSKELTKQERELLFNEICKSSVEYNYIIIPPWEIDERRRIMSLNELEALKIAELIQSFENSPKEVIVDSPDIIADQFALRIKKYLREPVKIKTEHKADKRYPVVSAASIIAKVIRDREIEKLEKQYGKIGTGYPHDEDTLNFIERWIEEHGELPAFARKTWWTSIRLLDKKFQRKLNDFF